MKKNIFFITGILAFLILAPVSVTWCQKLSANVIAVEKGDVIKILHEGKIIAIALYGIDCPEPLTPYGQKALQFTTRTALNQSVVIEIQNHQSETYYTGTVILPDETVLNQNLVKKGLATWDRQNAPDDIKLQSLESLAKEMHTGLWARSVAPDNGRTKDITQSAKNPSKHKKATPPIEKTRSTSPLPILAITAGSLIVILAALIFLALQYKKNFRNKKTPQTLVSPPQKKSETTAMGQTTQKESDVDYNQVEKAIQSNKLAIQGLLNNLSDFVSSLVKNNSTYTDQINDHKASIKNIMTQAGVEEIKRLLLLEIDQMQNNNNIYREQLAQANDTVNEQQQRMKEIQLDAKLDFLTGLANRRAFDENLRKEFERVRRYGDTFSLAMLDIDFFKKVNDEYSHVAGDNALKIIAKLLMGQTRINDVVARFGGDEFVILLPNTPLDQARIVMEKIRQKVEANTILHDGHKLKVTISAGAGEINLSAETTEDLIARVDTALYQAKKSGRNRVVVATINQPPTGPQRVPEIS
jgi:diguanylate cyclase (GGDEF)-like protein